MVDMLIAGLGGGGLFLLIAMLSRGGMAAVMSSSRPLLVCG